MKLSAILAPMIAANVPGNVILDTVKAFEEQQADALEQRRKVDAERQARKRERDASRDVTLRHSDRSLMRAGDARVEDKTSNLDIEPKKKDKTPSGDVAEFKAELSPHLSADQLDALVKHRRTKRAQNTAHAARLFIRDAEAAGLSVADAADTCISRNWITVKADWLKPNQRGSPQQAAPSLADVFAIAARTPRHENQPEPPEDRRGVQQAIPHLSAVRTG